MLGRESLYRVKKKSVGWRTWQKLYNEKVMVKFNYNVNKYIQNTELAIHALDQVHCWGAYFCPRIGHYEKFTSLNFQPHLFSKQ
jgi:hypothetical protein